MWLSVHGVKSCVVWLSLLAPTRRILVPSWRWSARNYEGSRTTRANGKRYFLQADKRSCEHLTVWHTADSVAVIIWLPALSKEVVFHFSLWGHEILANNMSLLSISFPNLSLYVNLYCCLCHWKQLASFVSFLCKWLFVSQIHHHWSRMIGTLMLLYSDQGWSSWLKHGMWTGKRRLNFYLWPPYVIRGPLYFCPVVSFFLLSSFYLFFSSRNLSGRRLDVYHTSRHGVALVRI